MKYTVKILLLIIIVSQKRDLKSVKSILLPLMSWIHFQVCVVSLLTLLLNFSNAASCIFRNYSGIEKGKAKKLRVVLPTNANLHTQKLDIYETVI